MTDAAATQAEALVAPARWQILAAVFVGGALGTLLRAGCAEALPHEAGAWPWATLAVNVVGALVIGFASAWVAVREVDPLVYPRLATGFCGGLTTFATLQVELVDLVEDRAWGVAAGYVVLSLAAGLVAVVVGRATTLWALGGKA